MSTENFGLPTSVYGRISLRLAVLNGFKIIDKTLKDLQDASGGPTGITAADITDASSLGRDLLTAADGAAVRQAIGAGTSSFSGSYDDLSGKPTIPAAPANGSAALIQAGTDTTPRVWTAADLATEIDRRIAEAIPEG